MRASQQQGGALLALLLLACLLGASQAAGAQRGLRQRGGAAGLGAGGSGSRGILLDDPFQGEAVKYGEARAQWGLDSLRSSHDCAPSQTGQAFNVCRYSKLLLFRGQLYYVADRAALPAAPGDWMLTKGPGIKVISSLSELGVPADTSALRFEVAPLIDTGAKSGNYFHIVGQQLPTLHGVLCKHAQLCDLGAPLKSKLRLVMVNRPGSGGEGGEAGGGGGSARELARPVKQDWTSCFSGAPVVAKDGPALSDRLVLLDSALAMFGSECGDARPDECGYWDFRSTPAREVMRSYASALAACLGTFDAQRAVSFSPFNLLVVNRDYWAGRHVLNVADMERKLNERYAAQGVAVTVAYLEKMSLAEQAALFNAATAVIFVTGAAMANAIFLPSGAAAMHVGLKQRPMRVYHDADAFVGSLGQDVQLHHMQTPEPDRIVLRSYWVYKHAEYQALPDDDKLRIWEEKVCPGAEGSALNALCEDVWIGRGGQLEMDIGHMFGSLDAFMPRLLEAKARAASR